jgi:hypothetical protein
MAFSRNDDGGDATQNIAPTMRVAGHAGGMLAVAQPVAYAVRTANTSANGHGVAQEVSHTLDQAQGQIVAIQGNLIGREAGGPQGVGASEDGVMYTLTKMDVHGVAQPINFYGGNKRSDRPEGGFYVRMDEDTSKTLDAASGLNPTCSQGGTAVMQPIPIDTMNHIGRGDSHSFGDFQPGAPSYTLTKGHSHAVAQPIAWDEELNASVEQAGTLLRGGQGGRHDGVLAPTLTAANNPSRSPQSTEVTQQVWSVMQATQSTACEVADALSVGANQTTGRPGDIASYGMQVRRLTPMECERLQGFPDGYTAIPWRGKPVDECPDGPRYKALGNSWAVPVVRWIGRRIQQEVQGKVPS